MATLDLIGRTICASRRKQLRELDGLSWLLFPSQFNYCDEKCKNRDLTAARLGTRRMKTVVWGWRATLPLCPFISNT